MTLRPAVIAYHAIGSRPESQDPHELFVHEDVFEEQMDFLARRRSVVPLDSVVDGTVRTPRPPVAITFDDGYRSVIDVAGPVLAGHGFPSTLFVPTSWLGKFNAWIGPPAPPIDILSADELSVAERLGIRVESHGSRHIKYWEAAPDEVETDVTASIRRLSDILGRPPQYLAYPFGPTSPAAMQIVQRCGLEAAFTLNEPPRGRYAFERIWIRPRHGIRIFAVKTSGYWSASWRSSKAGRAAAAALRPLVGRCQ
jgi:peptidoglycan/xylan/chitin deacetylase (PgdA/CDA1 family)